MTDIAGALSILWPALVAGILVSLSHVPLGQQVLRRGIVFIDLAIAQVAALGVIAAQTAGLELQGWTPARIRAWRPGLRSSVPGLGFGVLSLPLR